MMAETAIVNSVKASSPGLRRGATVRAAGEGRDATVITDASVGISKECHGVAIQRMVAAGANPMTLMPLAGQRQCIRSEGA